jgi:hypothetical protein
MLPPSAAAKSLLPRYLEMPSSVIRSFAYLPADRRLEIVFVSGRRYAYLDVPGEVAEDFSRSFAKGEFFNAHIRDRFRYEPQTAEA